MLASPRSLSRPSSPSAESSSKRTNSLAITPVPKEFFHPLVLSHLHAHFEAYGVINQWVPLPGFGRILVVYEDEEYAENAKRYSDPIALDATHDRPELVMRVYRADPNPLLSTLNSEDRYLQPPEIERNFLISPPGTPPVGWEPIQEDPPNSTPLADDLIAALKNLHLQQDHMRGSGVEVILDATESGVSVVVEDFDFGVDEERASSDEEDSWVYGVTMPSRTMWKPMPAALPPMRSSTPVPVY
ncbi:hypothetical protein V5O48_014842 [Marasmius crinis-equi]|uniref:Calcineurin-binding protein n=1 Tax=Marasmius crinis-equi TaxID=585013 RepID=A0ABR3EW51_9AGAR